MKKRCGPGTRIAVLLLAVLPGLSLAADRGRSPAPRATGTPAEQVCAEIQTLRDKVPRLPSAFRAFLEVLWIQVAPEAITRAMPLHFKTAPGLLVAEPHRNGRNLIFSLEISPEVERSPEMARMRARYAELTPVFERERGKFAEAVQAGSARECVARIREQGFVYDNLVKLAQERSSLHAVELANESRGARDAVGDALEGLKLHWDVFRATSLEAVYGALRSPTVANVVVLAHAGSDGRLYDSRLNEYPVSFFNAISPALRSLSVFSCHGEKVAETYKLAEAFAASPTRHSRRTLYLAEGKRILGLEEVVPINSFASFLKAVDGELFEAGKRERSVSTVLAKEQAPSAMCALRFQGLRVARGSYGVLLNGKFVGAVHEGRLGASAPVVFPCERLDRPRNLVVLRDLRPGVDSQVRDTDFTPVLWSASRYFTLVETEHFRRDDGAYQSSKWVFGE